jgi:hypothetical protein
MDEYTFLSSFSGLAISHVSPDYYNNIMTVSSQEDEIYLTFEVKNKVSIYAKKSANPIYIGLNFASSSLFPSENC